MMSREPEAIWIEPTPPNPRQRERDIEQEVAQITYQRETQRALEAIDYDTQQAKQAAEQAQDISQHFDEYVEASVRDLQVEYQYLFQEWGSQEFTRGDLEWLRDQIAEKRKWTIEELNARLQSLHTDQADLAADIKLQQWNLYCAAKEFESLDDRKYDGPDVSDYLGEGDSYDPYIVSDQANSWDGADSWFQTDSWDQSNWDQSDVLSGFNILNESDALSGFNILNEYDAMDAFSILYEPDAMSGFNILYEPDAMDAFSILYEPDALSGFDILNEYDAMSGAKILAEPDTMSGANILNEVDAMGGAAIQSEIIPDGNLDGSVLDPFSTGPDAPPPTKPPDTGWTLAPGDPRAWVPWRPANDDSISEAPEAPLIYLLGGYAIKDVAKDALSDPDGDTKAPVEGLTKGPPKPSPKFEPPTNPPQLPPTEIPEGLRVRTMPPTEQYPNGYWKLEKPLDNGGWQGIDPSTMKPGAHPQTHVPLPPKGK
jgi:hypothetical protein